MNKTLEFYRKLAEAYKEHGFEDYAVSELWTALEKAVLADTELVEALQRHVKMFDMVCGKVTFGDAFLDAETIGEWNDASIQAAKAIRKHKGD